MKYNLGCGSDIKPDYCNVDFRKTDPSVMEVDLSKFPWPFADESSEEILMLDFLEHFPYRDTKKILLECFRILKPEGAVIIQVPDAAILANVLLERKFQCNRCGYWINDGDYSSDAGMDCCFRCHQSHSDAKEAAMMRMFGGQDFPGNFHQTCFTKEMLVSKADECGLMATNVSLEEQEHQAANWNFMYRFLKKDIW